MRLPDLHLDLSVTVCYIVSMRDYFNPLVLLAVVGLFARGMAGDGDAGVWVLVLCVTAFLVNGALSLARMFARRPVLKGVVWTVAYLILGSCAWVMLQTPATDVYEEEKNELAAQLSEWKELGKSPFASAQQERDCLVVLAAGLGKNKLLRELLALPDAGQNITVLQQAARAAVENGQRRSLQLLLEKGVSADAAVAGASLLSGAVIHGQREIVRLLLERGATPDRPDAEGVPPIMHAVINDDLPTARLLMQHGANPAAKAPDGRDAHSCSRTAEMDAVLKKEAE